MLTQQRKEFQHIRINPSKDLLTHYWVVGSTCENEINRIKKLIGKSSIEISSSNFTLCSSNEIFTHSSLGLDFYASIYDQNVFTLKNKNNIR